MKLAFCAACGSTNGLHHHPLVTHAQGGGDDERDLITLCFPCHAKLRPRRLNGVANISRQELDRLAAVGVFFSGES